MPLASLGTGAYILTHTYIHLKITKNECLKKKKTKEAIQGSLPDTWFIDGFLFFFFSLLDQNQMKTTSFLNYKSPMLTLKTKVEKKIHESVGRK